MSETCSAWRKLKRTVSLWLGNAVIFLAEENPWQDRTSISSTLEGASATDMIAAEATQSPLLMSTVSHFVHDLIAGSWETRMAAAKALTCIAVQCQEPYRIQVYQVFKGILASENFSFFGLTDILSRVLGLLDRMYSGQMMVEECVVKWGGSVGSWPEGAVDSVRKRHSDLMEEVLQHCQVPPDLFFPLGPKSRSVILGEDMFDTLQTQSSVAFEPPQAQFSDYLKQGTLEIDEGFDQELVEEEVQSYDLSPTEMALRGSERTRSYLDCESLIDLIGISVP